MATYPIKMLKDEHGQLFIPLTNSDSVQTSTGATLETMISNKVDKETGKGLSTNDYTTTEKQKLAGLENYELPKASSNTLGGIKVGTNLSIDSNGVLSADAQHIDVDSALSATSENPVQNKIIKNALDDKVDKVSGKSLSTNDYTTDEKNKLAGIAAGAEVNQNAFSNVKVGSTTIAADGKTDTLTLAAGSNVTLTPDASGDKVTIAATDTTYESKAAASGGTDISLVTTGEKYTWNNKQNALSTQTAYSTKGTATKVPQITTNTLGQVTKIEEVTITQPTVNNGQLTIQKNGTNVATFTANQSGNSTANITVPTKVSELTNDSGFLTSHQSLNNYVTLDGAQTITGTKTFDEYNDALASNSSTKNVLPSASALSAAPFAVDFWHDHFAFLNSHTIISNKVTNDGSTWTDSSTNLVDLFNQKESQVVNILAASNLSRQIIINSSNLNYSSITWWEFGVTYSSPFSSFKILIEKSSDNATYSTIHESTISGNSNPYYCYGPIGGAFPYIRITFTKTSNLTTGTVSLSCIKAYTTRKGNQGLGREFSFPYNWNSSRDIYPWSNNTQELGTSSYKWKNVYATTFTGNLTGTASKATGDKNGNDITTTYYLASNPNGYTSNKGTVTSIGLTAGSGISISGGPITSSGNITVGHSNSITAQTTSGLYPIKIDAQGHITQYGEAYEIATEEEIKTMLSEMGLDVYIAEPTSPTDYIYYSIAR